MYAEDCAILKGNLYEVCGHHIRNYGFIVYYSFIFIFDVVCIKKLALLIFILIYFIASYPLLLEKTCFLARPDVFWYLEFDVFT